MVVARGLRICPVSVGCPPHHLLRLNNYAEEEVQCLICLTTESGEDVDGPPPLPMNSKEGGKGILNLKAYEEDTIKGGYVLSQEGRKWNRLWYQLKQDFCLYKFRAHEVLCVVYIHNVTVKV